MNLLILNDFLIIYQYQYQIDLFQEDTVNEELFKEALFDFLLEFNQYVKYAKVIQFLIIFMEFIVKKTFFNKMKIMCR